MRSLAISALVLIIFLASCKKEQTKSEQQQYPYQESYYGVTYVKKDSSDYTHTNYTLIDTSYADTLIVIYPNADSIGFHSLTYHDVFYFVMDSSASYGLTYYGPNYASWYIMGARLYDIDSVYYHTDSRTYVGEVDAVVYDRNIKYRFYGARVY